MEIASDFKDLLRLFNAENVEYMIVGGYALAHLGAPRYTGDLDIYIKPELENAHRVLRALNAFGFASLEFTVTDFTELGNFFQLGFPPVRVDLITSIDAVSWEQALHGRSAGQLGDVPVFYIGKAEFIENKRATGRIQDLADVEALKKPEIK